MSLICTLYKINKGFIDIKNIDSIYIQKIIKYIKRYNLRSNRGSRSNRSRSRSNRSGSRSRRENREGRKTSARRKKSGKSRVKSASFSRSYNRSRNKR